MRMNLEGYGLLIDLENEQPQSMPYWRISENADTIVQALSETEKKVVPRDKRLLDTHEISKGCVNLCNKMAL